MKITLQVISLFVSFVFTANAFATQQIHVSENKMKILLKRPGVQIIALNDIEQKKKKDEKEKEEEQVKDEDFDSGFNIPSNSGSGDGAVLVFAIIGTIAIVAWVPLLYLTVKDMIRYKSKIELDHVLGLEYTYIAPSGGDVEVAGTLSNLYYGVFIKRTESFGVGLASTFGTYNLKASFSNGEEDISSEYRHANFIMVGPSVRVFLREGREQEKTFINFELLAGKTDIGDDFMSMARIKMNVGFPNTKDSFWSDTYWGINLGATYYKIDEYEGIFNKADPFNYGIGFSIDKAF